MDHENMKLAVDMLWNGGEKEQVKSLVGRRLYDPDVLKGFIEHRAQVTKEEFPGKAFK